MENLEESWLCECCASARRRPRLQESAVSTNTTVKVSTFNAALQSAVTSAVSTMVSTFNARSSMRLFTPRNRTASNAADRYAPSAAEPGGDVITTLLVSKPHVTAPLGMTMNQFHGGPVFVLALTADGAAAQAGMVEGDALIAVNDQQVEFDSSPTQAALLMSSSPAGTATPRPRRR